MMIGDIVRSVARIPDRITRMVYIRECANILEIEEKILYTETDEIRERRQTKDGASGMMIEVLYLKRR
jgi:DNA primase